MKYLLCALTTLAAVAWCAAPARASVIVNAPRSIGLTNGLVGWWTFDGKDVSGTVGGATPRQIYDRSGTGNVGKYYNATTTLPTIGKIGQGLSFDGVNDYVDAGDSSALQVTTQLTMSAWIKFNGTGVRYHPISKDSNESATDGWTMEREHDNKLYLVTGGEFQGTTNTFTDTTSFHHIVMTFNSGAAAIYYDGVKQALGGSGNFSFSSLPTSTSHLNLGRDGSNVDYLTGLMDDVRIYNRALNADEIKRLYNLGGTVKLNQSLNPLQNGLVGWWTFDRKDISGVQAYDRSGNGNRGILRNGPTRVIGKIGQGLSFDGVNNWVNNADPANNSLDPTSEYSLSVWVTYTSAANYGYILSKTDSGGQGGYELFRNGGTGQIRFSACDTGGSCAGGYFDVTTDASYNDGTWHHIMATAKTNGQAKIYIDGQLVKTSGTITQDNIQNSLDLRIGSRGEGSGNNPNEIFNGLIDDVRIYNRILSPDEIKRLYNLGGTVKLNTSQNLNNNNSLQNGLVGWWTFDGKDMAGSYAFDKSGNGNRGTLTGTNGVPTRTIGKIGQGLSFDGVDDYVSGPSSSTLTPSSITVSAWVKPVALPAFNTNMGLVDKRDDGGGTAGWVLQLSNDTGTQQIIWISTSGAPNALIINRALVVGEWAHLVVTQAGTTVTIYVNGVQIGSQTGVAALVDYNTALSIGRRADGNYLKGAMDDVRIYNRALSSDEIKRLYNMGR